MLREPSRRWRAGQVLLSALKAWTCLWLALICIYTVASLRNPSHQSWADALSILLIWVVCTGVVTLVSTAALIVPYGMLRSPATLLRIPFLVYVESTLLVLPVALFLTHWLRAPVDTFWMTFKIYGTFALVTSLLASFFYVRSLKRAMRSVEKQENGGEAE